ncbi:uncharacterized protein LOC131658523 [Vicia villosa]|uniref:uncharacterized protein LOC131658523 n=1 Tax=Vicia villosa TaxID=3911 RepID=UPI00273CB32E|nr:uncharacterized protein LOC131658523 [Vicia villosa]
MNVALPSKWKWRILTEKDAVWRDLLVARYGNIKLKVLVGDSSVVHKNDLVWWRDLIISDNYEKLLLENFTSVVRVIVGNGVSTPFWYANWSGQRSLMEEFPTLFSLANNHLSSIFSTGFLVNNGWNWALPELFQEDSIAFRLAANDGEGVSQSAAVVESHRGREEPQGAGSKEAAAIGSAAGSAAVRRSLCQLKQLLRPFVLQQAESDLFYWQAELDGNFSVKSFYVFPNSKLLGEVVVADRVRALSHLWKVKVPSKILFFAWRFIYNRIATRDHLVRRGILMEGRDSFCVFCSKEEESRDNLFSNCVVSIRVWRRVYMWLGVGEILSFDEFVDFFFNCEKINCLSKKAILSVVWLATIWTLWNKRNAIIFKDESFSFIECMSEITISSWHWLGSFYKKVPVCNFFGWNTQPLLCFSL